ncbi:hypothetical protein Q0N40_10350 [Corynebacterium pseudokroppenstedtii]|uniref:Uncharacterized protein n=1 Tax=Corynebacterium pseudokroppenstedtii TaxID=2804917 RepID=A0AAU0PZG8_9CORY|nr:hypothetical protein [Corynebacterium pseudokroppenstedtii]MDU6479365.1 hypothetical protein [Corynebacterium kroppenstedtii]MBY0790456.1 hypothetical protein [Corynebacterium pseudokroppenstedtii]MCF6793003.1 hypothetical protein [Corynebacterium pseudokroppenstedtii]MCF8702200.1 hypothetical protein [Corynebacterium pseudokroppenstedtii]MCG2635656.1 hypothetical protein [Corynebacterium pseudokroppenstedtii]
MLSPSINHDAPTSVVGDEVEIGHRAQQGHMPEEGTPATEEEPKLRIKLHQYVDG